MKQPRLSMRDFLTEDSGQDLVEYALIVALVALGAIAGLNSLANAIANIPNALLQTFYRAYTSS